MAVDWTKLIPEDPSVEMIEALDEVIHDHFAGKATEITNQGVEAMVEFIRTEIDGSELNTIFHREYKGEQDFYFLVPTPHQGWCFFRGSKDAPGTEPIDFCLMVHRRDKTQHPIILGACTVRSRRPVDEDEKGRIMNTLEQFPAWRQDPASWGWVRHENVAEIPSVWWPAHREFFDNRADQRMKERMAASPPSEYAKLQAVMNAAECGDEAAADFLRRLEDMGYGLIPLNEAEPLSEEIRGLTSSST